MKKYRVNVNGTNYEILLEALGETGTPVAATASAPAAAPAPVAAPAPAAAPAPVAAGNGQKVEAPMPGTILKVNVAAGDAVKAGDVLMILEAMKMENEIMCPADGKIGAVAVAQGQSVDTGALLCTIE